MERNYYFKNEETGMVIRDWPTFVAMVEAAEKEKEVFNELGGLNVLGGEYEYEVPAPEGNYLNSKTFFFILNGKDLGNDMYELKNGKLMDVKDVRDSESFVVNSEKELCELIYFIDNSCTGGKNKDVSSPIKIAPKLSKIRRDFDKEKKEKATIGAGDKKQMGEE